MTEYAGHARHMVKGSRENGIPALSPADCSGVLVIGGDGTVCEVLILHPASCLCLILHPGCRPSCLLAHARAASAARARHVFDWLGAAQRDEFNVAAFEHVSLLHTRFEAGMFNVARHTR